MPRCSKDLLVAGGYTVGAVIIAVLCASLLGATTHAFKDVDLTTTGVASPKDFDAYVATPKSLYVWSHTTDSTARSTPAWVSLLQNEKDEAVYLAKFCRQHGFTEVYLFVGSVEWEYDDFFSKGEMPYTSALRSTVSILTEMGLKTHFLVYLNDAVNNLESYEKITGVAEAAANFQQRYPNLRIGTLHIDQEPSDPAQYEKYIKMLGLASAYMPISAALKPLWLRTTLTSISDRFSLFDLSLEIPSLINIADTAETFSDVIYYLTSGSAIMAYSDRTEQIVELAQDSYRSASRVGITSVKTAIETGYTNNLPEDETLHYEIVNNKDSWFTRFMELHGMFDTSSNGLGVSQNIVIHDYAQYFKTLYCVLPIDQPDITGYAYIDCSNPK
ncbi:hypothetical protein GMRT_10038 [Giardia muris]|uniref:Uncharacterized protein n=1 Tax=Giardia muris TaxID=5742 RepID=A0A4Z1SQC0_GIAMU|nr:hypothetical protein GMRT_10038 [Giardia muris]|eukprot:TNJ28044.1 hypothetical protein GMRT_10038 [Giardia muris]